MLGVFRRKGGLRAVLAALFVYVLFGHAVLADIVSARMALGSADSVICHAAGDDSSGGTRHSDIHHQGCVVCAFAGATPPLAAAVGIVETVGAAHAVPFHQFITAASIAREHDPRTSQGPPQAA